MTNELITKAKACKNADELLALAKDNGIELTEDEAKAKYAELHLEGELSDDELDGAAGGGGCSQAAEKEPEQVMMPENYGCPNCGDRRAYKTVDPIGVHYQCAGCGNKYTFNMFGSTQVGGNNII